MHALGKGRADGFDLASAEDQAIAAAPLNFATPMAPGGRLAGKAALVTGGTSGIGAEIVRRFVSEGATVVCVGRNQQAGATIVDELGLRARFIRADVSREEELAAAITAAADWGGRLDILVNNAGSLTTGGVESVTDEDFTGAMALVLGSVLFGIKHAAPLMRRQGWGAIINNSSVAAHRTDLGGYLYSVAKAGVSHATRLAGMELGRYGVTVNSISPGAVATPLYFGGSHVVPHLRPDRLGSMNANLAANLARTTPVARAGQPSDIAAAALYLASDEGHFVNCHDLIVDGGMTASACSDFAARHELEYGGVA